MKANPKFNPVLRYYWRTVKPDMSKIIGLLIIVPITVLVNSYLPPLILASVLSRLSQHNYISGDIWQSFGPVLLLYGALIFSGILLWRVVDYFMWGLELSVQQRMAEEVFDHLIHESADFHANNFSGSLVSQTSKLLGSYVRTADTIIFQVIPMVCGIIFAAVILLPKAPWFSLVLVIASLLFVTLSTKATRETRRLSARFSVAESEQTGYLADAITNVMAIKSFAQETYEKERFHKATLKTRRRLHSFANAHQWQMVKLGSGTRTMTWLALFTAVASVLLFDANIAAVFLIFSYTSTVVEQLFTFSNNSLRTFNRAFGDAAEMVTKLGETPAVLDPASPETANIQNGELVLKDVTFAHTGSDGAIFDKLNIHIRHGEKVGLVGHSGSGKTTLTRILLRFSDIDSGTITLGGQNIAHITQADLHSKIAYVPQEPLLFHRSIAENIAYGDRKASKEDIARATRSAHATEFIDQLPNGYETLVGERGVKLSGGQRQRIAIARAMLKDAPLLVLDEATSALDSESEGLIQDALWKLMENRTTIVIAHRLSTIQRMDRIIVLDNGRIVEEGSHSDLIKHGHVYADLWNRQSGGFIDD